MRTLNAQLQKHKNQTVNIKGWLHKKRLLGGVNFIVLRDRSGLIQVLVDDDKEVKKLQTLQTGTVLEINGKVVADKRAPSGVEIHSPSITVLVPVTETPPIEIDKPLDHRPQNLETLFDNRVIGLRNQREAAIFKIQAELKEAIRQYYRSNDFVEFNSPKLLPGATEGGAEVFKLDHFGKEATLAQSAQFYKQIMVGVYERVFEINPTYRAEPSATTRHMSEFIHLDVEVGFVDFEELMNLAGTMLREVVEAVWKSCANELAMWQAVKPVLPKVIPALSLVKVHELYSSHNQTKTLGEKDLRPDEEKWICEYAAKNLKSEAVFVTDWPASDAKFYHKLKDKDPKTAERFDLLFRGIEIMTGSMREHRYEVLLKQLKAKAHGDPKHPGFKYYLQAFLYGLPPHGGFAMGLERLTEKVVGLGNVKEATLFPRDIHRLSP